MQPKQKKIAEAIIQTNTALNIDVHTSDGLTQTKRGILTLMSREEVAPEHFDDILRLVLSGNAD